MQHYFKILPYPPISIIGRLLALCEAISAAEVCPPSTAFFLLTASDSRVIISASDKPSVRSYFELLQLTLISQEP